MKIEAIKEKGSSLKIDLIEKLDEKSVPYILQIREDLGVAYLLLYR
jgi:hypothetical protein